ERGLSFPDWAAVAAPPTETGSRERATWYAQRTTHGKSTRRAKAHQAWRTAMLDAPDMPAAAAHYAAHNWAIFPCHWPIFENGSVRCSCWKGADCDHIAKHPLTEHGVHDASRDPEAVRWWWNKWPNANIGLAAGKINNLLVL